MKNPISKAKRGFTLVELLVVVAIIATLAAVTFTIAPKMIKKSKQVASISNMRQVAILMNGYAAENGGKLPAPREENTGNNGSTRNTSLPGMAHWHEVIIADIYPGVTRAQIGGDRNWWISFSPIVANPQFLKTPDFETWYPGFAMNFNIAANVLSGAGWFEQSRYRTPVSSIPDLARTPLLMPHFDWHSSRFLSGNALTSNTKQNVFLIDGKLNIVFVDGHSELIQFTKPDMTRIPNCEYVKRKLHLMPIL